MGLSETGYIVLCYCLSISLLVGFGMFAVYMAYKSGKSSTTENFLTARNQVKLFRIAWSFYASAVGAWVLVGPASYAAFAGWIGLVSYSVAAGLPIIAIAFLGDVLQKVLPDALSLSDFIGLRFGAVPQAFVVLLTIFNMGIAMLAEYSTIGALFASYVGSIAYPIIIVVGVVTMIYTAYGGLAVSIITDQVQGIASVSFFAILVVYVAVTFRYPLPQPLPENLAANSYGYSSLFSMPVSMMTATVFSEAMWQRVWASESPRALKAGATLGALGVSIAVALAGFAGFLAVWAGLVNEQTNPNLYLFAVLQEPTGSDPHVSNWVGVLALVLAVTMNESAVDSLQNGMVASVAGHLFKGKSVAWARAAVVVINVPLLILGAQGYTVLDLFLLTNMLCSTSALPVLSGIFPRLDRYVNGITMLCSCLLSMLSVSVFGVGMNWNSEMGFWSNVSFGLEYAWLKNGYDWKYLAMALFSSIGFMLVGAGVMHVVAKGGRCRVPGFVPLDPELKEGSVGDYDQEVVPLKDAKDVECVPLSAKRVS